MSGLGAPINVRSKIKGAGLTPVVTALDGDVHLWFDVWFGFDFIFSVGHDGI